MVNVGKISHLANNQLNRGFAPTALNKAWVSDITYVRTYGGWLYGDVALKIRSLFTLIRVANNTSSDWQNFLKLHNLVCSMSRCGNCHDNVATESFFQLLKRKRIKRRIYKD